MIRTDHAALTGLMRASEVNGQQARYLEFIAQFDFEIVNRPDSSHGNCDSLSRRPTNSDESEVNDRLEDADEPKDVRTMEILMVGPNDQYTMLYWTDVW